MASSSAPTTQTIIVAESSKALTGSTATTVPFVIKGESKERGLDMSLWTSVLQGLLQYTRVVYDLFPKESLVSSLVAGSGMIRVLNSWDAEQQNVTRIFKSLAEVPKPKDDGEPLIPGIRAALKLLAQRPSKSSSTCLRVIHLRHGVATDDVDPAFEAAKDILLEWRQRVGVQAEYLELMDILVTEAEGPVLVRSDRSAQLGCFQYAVPGPDLVSFFSKAVQQHFALRSARVTGIPMKGASSDKSRSYDVVLLHPSPPHAISHSPALAPAKDEAVKKVKTKSSKKKKKAKTGAVVEENLSLQWRLAAETRLKGDPAMQPCLCVHRVTPLNVGPQKCHQKSHMLYQGKTVTLGLTGASQITTSHLLISHSGSVFLHCLSHALSHLESAPSITACNGGSVGDYRVGAFSDAILVNQLCGDVKSEESAVHDTLPFINIPLHSEPKPERVTKHFPLTFGRTHLFSETDIGDQARNMNKKLISAMKQRELGSEQEIQQFFMSKRANSDSLAGQSRTSKRQEAYAKVTEELRGLLMHAASVSARHNELWLEFDRAAANRPEAQKEPAGWQEMDVVESMTTRELQDANQQNTNNSHRPKYEGGGIPPNKTNMCFDHSNGWCMRGDNCRFSHDGPEGAANKKCYHCGQTGHLYRHCPMRQQAAEGPTSAAAPEAHKRRFSELAEELSAPIEGDTSSLRSLWNTVAVKRPRTFAGSDRS